MTYKTDHGGLAFKCSDIKLMALTGSSTWATRLSQLHRMTGTVRIITYSLPRMDYVKKQLGRRPHNIYIIAHEKFLDRAFEINRTFREIKLSVRDDIHAKVLLIAPRTLYISSANFGDSGWYETTIGIHSKTAHDWYVNEFNWLWDRSVGLTKII